MNKTDKLLFAFSSAVKAGGGIHTAAELAYMTGEQYTPTFTKFLTDCVKKGVLRRVATGIFESTLTPPDPSSAIFKIVKKLRGGVLNYISLESQLSYTGDISQVLIDRLTEDLDFNGGRDFKPSDFTEELRTQVDKLLQDEEVHKDFNMEMSRFVPGNVKERTLDNPDYWTYVQSEIKNMSTPLLDGDKPKNKFDMSF
jgi:hypothetical protein